MQVNFNRCMHRMESQLLLLLGKITKVATFGVLMRTGGRQSDLPTKRVGTDFRPGHPMVRRSLFSKAISTTCMSAVKVPWDVDSTAKHGRGRQVACRG